MKQPAYANHSHQVIIESLNMVFKFINGPIMLTANQLDKYWSVSVNFMSTGVHIPKSEIDETEVRSIPEEYGRFIVNKVWDQVN